MSGWRNQKTKLGGSGRAASIATTIATTPKKTAPQSSMHDVGAKSFGMKQYIHAIAVNPQLIVSISCSRNRLCRSDRPTVKVTIRATQQSASA